MKVTNLVKTTSIILGTLLLFGCGEKPAPEKPFYRNPFYSISYDANNHPYAKVENTLDNNGSITAITNYSYNQSTYNWDPTTKTLYYILDDNSVTERKQYIDGEFKNYSKQVNSSEADRYILSIFTVDNQYNYFESTRIDTVIDNAGKVVESNTYSYNYSTSSLYKSGTVSYTYNERGQNQTLYTYNFDTTGKVTATYKSEYSYNDKFYNEKTIDYKLISEEYVPQTKVEYKYNDNGSVIEIKYFQYRNDAWKVTSKAVYQNTRESSITYNYTYDQLENEITRTKSETINSSATRVVIKSNYNYQSLVFDPATKTTTTYDNSYRVLNEKVEDYDSSTSTYVLIRTMINYY